MTMTTLPIFDRVYNVSESIATALAACNQGHNMATYGRLVNADIPPERLYNETREEHLLAMSDAMLIYKYSMNLRTLRGINRAYELMDFVERGRLIAIDRL